MFRWSLLSLLVAVPAVLGGCIGDGASDDSVGGSAGPPAVTLEVEARQVQIYGVVNITWNVTGKARNESDTVHTYIEITGDDNATLIGERNTSIPDNFSVTWEPQEDGRYRLVAVAHVDGEEIRSEPVQLDVAPVQPTGVEHTITVQPLGPAARLSPDTLTLKAGDAVVWQNDDAVSRQFVSTEGPEEFDSGNIAAGGASQPLVLTIPGEYPYQASDQASLDGTITVEKP